MITNLTVKLKRNITITIHLTHTITILHYLTVTTKAVAGAKSLGNFLYSAVNKAGAKVSEASAKIKKTVEENVSSLKMQ